ncbi:Sphingomyelin phosphodiesterase [Halocaridina rubra]|uniref:Sphingomyelin phosphodiesterase n=1 Tax=Halocaridina rubra TaxID=373956 RepID=A0AAN8WZP6_HALRR
MAPIDSVKENILYASALYEIKSLITHIIGFTEYNTNSHDCFSDSFPTPAVYDEGWTIDWLYDNLAEMYTPWLPEDTKVTIKRGGFFAYSPLPGLKVISLNMNYCNRINWWLLLDNEDPVGEVQWLIDELLASEAAGEKVHILGHIPSGGGDCDHTWSHVFNTVITRFESTVRGVFFGHNHKEAWAVYYDYQNTTRPIAVAFVSAAEGFVTICSLIPVNCVILGQAKQMPLITHKLQGTRRRGKTIA